MTTDSPSLQKVRSLMADAQNPINWVFAGDSITHGAYHLFGHRDYTEHFTERLRYEIGRRLDAVIKTGISGWKITNIQTHLQRVVMTHRPQVVSINIGMNDAKEGPANAQAFESVYRNVLDQINDQLQKPALILHTPQPIEHDGTPRFETLPVLCPIVRKIAQDYGAVLVDHEKAWSGESITYWLSDAIHPNHYGHRKMAFTLFEALGLYDTGKSHVCRLDIPRKLD